MLDLDRLLAIIQDVTCSRVHAGRRDPEFATASGIFEWTRLMVSEAQKGCSDLRDCHDHLKCVPAAGVTDCKSLFKPETHYNLGSLVVPFCHFSSWVPY